MRSRRHFLLGSAAGLVWVGAGTPRRALAQVIGKATRIVVGFPPGGVADVVARQLAERLRGAYAPTVIVDNRPGAGGTHRRGDREEQRRRRQHDPVHPQPDDHVVPARVSQARV